MRFLSGFFVFILALGLSYKAVAEKPADKDTETCTADQKEHCVDPKSEDHTHPEAKDEEKLAEKMNSLFPQKQKNASQSARPLKVKLSSPAFLAKVAAPAAKLEWTAAEGATNYHLQVATDPNFKWLVANDQWVKTTSFDVANLESGKRYYWRVAAVKDGNDAMFTKSLFVSSVFSTNP